MTKWIYVGVLALLGLWQGYLIYAASALLGPLEQFSPESGFTALAKASIPLYAIFLGATLAYGYSLTRLESPGKVAHFFSLCICALGTMFMQAHVLYVSYSPVFEATPK